MSTAERIMWGAWGVLSFIFLIVYLRWVGPPEDQQKRRHSERQSRKSGLIGWLVAGVNQLWHPRRSSMSALPKRCGDRARPRQFRDQTEWRQHRAPDREHRGASQ